MNPVNKQLQTLGGNYSLTPATLAHYLNPYWVPAPHLMYISQQIAMAIHKGNGRIIISVPPRHGKSELITKYTSVWCLEHFPHWNTILATYGAELSTDFGRAVRDIIQGNKEKLNVQIRQDSQRAARWQTPEGGGMAAVGIGGAITGRGANVLLIDDYIKEIKEAMSKPYKDYVYNWFKTVARTRIEPGGTCIIIATRWAPDDLIGRILQNDTKKRWQYIKLPAIAGEDDFLGRKQGEALFPERFDVEALHELKDEMGAYFFNALYQQDPEDEESALTNRSWLKIVDIAPPFGSLKKARIWDLAATHDGGDYTVGNHMGYDQPHNATYILNIIRRRLSPNEVESLVRQTAIADGTETKIYIEQEPGSSGKHLVEHFKNTVLPEFDVEAVPSNDGKIERSQPFLAQAEAGRIFLLKGSWNEAFIEEFGKFPTGDYDDQVDTASVGYTKLSGKRTFTVSWGRGNERDDLVAGKNGSVLIPTKKAGVIFGRSRRNG